MSISVSKMGPWVRPLFALFVLVDIHHEVYLDCLIHRRTSTDKVWQTLNEIVYEAYTEVMIYWLWLATKNYAGAPPKQGREVNLGTSTPVREDFSSSFIGYTIEEVATWLKSKPAEADLDAHHFVVVDKKSLSDNKFGVCKIGDERLKGDEVECIRRDPRTATTILCGMGFETGLTTESAKERGIAHDAVVRRLMSK